MEKQRLFVIDAYAMIYRSYYAFLRNPMFNSAGLNTSTIFAFTLAIDDIIRKEKPTHLVIAFDPGGLNFRHEMYEPYKANRKATPEEIKISVPYIYRIAEALNIPCLVCKGFEADDVIGTISRVAPEKGFQVFMVSPDKDLCQLVNENVFLFRPGKGKGNDNEILGIEQVKEKFSINSPAHVIDLLALWGDSSDNVPGAPGIGEKTAVKLLTEFGTLENLLLNTDKLKGKVKESLEQNKEQILLSKRLVTIDLNVPIELNFDEFGYQEPNKEKLLDLLKELEFRSLFTRFGGSSTAASTVASKVKAAPSAQTSLFDTPSADAPRGTSEQAALYSSSASVNHTYILVNDSTKREELASKLAQVPLFCFDTETTGLDPFADELIGISFSITLHEAYYVPVSQKFDDVQEELSVFKSLFENESIIKTGHNLKFDMQFLRSYGIEVKGTLFDTMIAHYLLQPDMSHKMDNMARAYLNYSPIPIEDLIGNKGPAQRSMRQVEIEKLTEYAAEDADITLQLAEPMRQQLVISEQTQLFEKVEMPMVRVLCDMEKEGFRLNVDFLNEYAVDLRTDILAIEKQIYELSGYEFNIASPKQLGEILFDRLKIATDTKKTKTQAYSTNEEVLTGLLNAHPIVPLILDYRGLVKLLNTYVEALPKMINPKTGNIHSSFNQTGTVTGRLSSTNPNLQNIPIKDDRGREIRKAFVSTWNNGYIVSADYSQIELRVMAHMSKDKSMIEAFHNKLDIHSATASKIFGVSIDEVTREQRRRAKTANFGIIYGISTFGLSQRLAIPRKEASELIEGYFTNFPRVKEFMDESIVTAREKGYAETLLNRRRFLPDLNSANGTVRNNAERVAINTPIQGSAADIIKLAMINIHQRILTENLRSRMILQVHDELVFNVPEDEKDILMQLVREEMTSALALDVPLEVEIGCGSNWFDAH